MVKIEEYFLIKNYTITDGLISTNDDVELIKKVKELPVQFGQIGGYFYCANNKLISLAGCPKFVGGDFSYSENQLTSLVGGPIEVDGYFDCYNNQLTSLEGAPQKVSGGFDCYNNKLMSLAGAPKSVGGYFDCRNNPLISLEGAPKSVSGGFYLTWSKDLSLLRLVIYKSIETYNDQVNEIIRKYSNHTPLKEAILLCQKELIDNGFIGNASW
jgi:hypothetical protein